MGSIPSEEATWENFDGLEDQVDFEGASTSQELIPTKQGSSKPQEDQPDGASTSSKRSQHPPEWLQTFTCKIE